MHFGTKPRWKKYESRERQGQVEGLAPLPLKWNPGDMPRADQKQPGSEGVLI